MIHIDRNCISYGEDSFDPWCSALSVFDRPEVMLDSPVILFSPRHFIFVPSLAHIHGTFQVT